VRIDMGSAQADQLAHLEANRTDIVSVSATDVRRIAQRNFRVSASRSLQLFSLMFEGPRAAPGGEPSRRALAVAIDRAAMCSVLLQRYGQPAASLLPPWLSGYASLVSDPIDRAASRAAVALAGDQRVESADAVAREIADRIAVDGREAGLTVKVDPSGSLGPRPDARLVSVRFDATTPERALASAMSAWGLRLGAWLGADAVPPPGAPIDASYRFERTLVEHYAIVPLVFLPELYGVGTRVESPDGRIVRPSGVWDLANVWLRSAAP
jgi:hypothetical protein